MGHPRYEGFKPIRLGGWEPLERVAAIAEGISLHGPAFAAWLSCDASRDPADADGFTDAYRGEWPLLREYAEDWGDSLDLDVSLQGVDVDPDVRRASPLGQPVQAELSIVECGNHGVFVFDAHV